MSQWGVWQTQSIFVQISIQRVPLKLILNHIFTNSQPPSCSETPSYISLLPHIPALPTSLIFHLITYSFTIIFQRDKGLFEWSWKQRSQGVDGAFEGVCERDGAMDLLKIHRTKDWQLFVWLDFALGFWASVFSLLVFCKLVMGWSFVSLRDMFMQVSVWQKECVPVGKRHSSHWRTIPHTTLWMQVKPENHSNVKYAK